MMKKNLGSTLALYPMPLVVVGAMVDGQPTWTLAGHVGILGHDRVLVSLAKVHYINRGIRETGALSINLVDEPMLPEADYVGSVSGANIVRFDCGRRRCSGRRLRKGQHGLHRCRHL